MMYKISLPRQESVCKASEIEEICGQKFRRSMAPPRTVSTAPVTRPMVRLLTRLAPLSAHLDPVSALYQVRFYCTGFQLYCLITSALVFVQIFIDLGCIKHDVGLRLQILILYIKTT